MFGTLCQKKVMTPKTHEGEDLGSILDPDAVNLFQQKA